MLFLGMDPGVSGGIAVIDTDNAEVVAVKMPSTERELLDTLSEFGRSGPIHAALEKLGGMPRGPGGTAMQSPKTMLTMGTNYGKCLMGLVAAEIPFDQVLPRTWQNEFSIVGKYPSTTVKKNKHKEVAEHLFPGVKVTHYIADALLLAEYCRRNFKP